MRFGTDGVRGVAGRWPVDEQGAKQVGAAVARWLGPGSTVWIAWDTRPSGDELARAVAAGVRAARGIPRPVGVMPTGAVSALLVSGRRAAVVVTASHNPARDNGFKVLGPGGWKLDDDQTIAVERLLAAPAPGGVAVPADLIGSRGEVPAEVVSAVLGAVGPLRALRGRRVVVDLARGAGLRWLPLLDRLSHAVGVRWILCGTDAGPINDGVGSEHPEHVTARVRAFGADAGIALDGDGDRCLLVDERGERVVGDALTAMLVRGRGVRRLGVTVMSTAAVEGWLPGVEVVRTPVGDRHLALLLKARRIELGAEESGHVLLGSPGLPGGDGLATGLATLCCAWTQARTVSRAAAPFEAWPRATAKVVVSRRPPLEEVPALVLAQREAQARLAGGRILLRYSGTEPVLRVLVEGPHPDVVRQVEGALTAACREALS